jgi:hypothetical protein
MMCNLPFKPELRDILIQAEFQGIPEARVTDHNGDRRFLDCLVVAKFNKFNEWKRIGFIVEIKTRDEEISAGETIRQIHDYQGLIDLEHNRNEYRLDFTKVRSILVTDNFPREYDDVFDAAWILVCHPKSDWPAWKTTSSERVH